MTRVNKANKANKSNKANKQASEIICGTQLGIQQKASKTEKETEEHERENTFIFVLISVQDTPD